eukprot:CAMPEP_0176418802 /NCGR_PEP_ID=MMETSP0127-20121128/7685_1 /TAXON_ID=938130 /ORGANISM="Platyophrya macrostoma, Strain WH" /LENGTH=238 /DNA_ID=CAMNT_0017799191 /DNA_START=108 /DNA_END=824 /DNA_ORIENTATION=+
MRGTTLAFFRGFDSYLASSVCTTENRLLPQYLQNRSSFRGDVLAGGSGGDVAPDSHGPGAAATSGSPADGSERPLQVAWSTLWPPIRDQYSEKLYGVELRFLSVTHLGPLEPHQFACHIETWVCDRKCRDKGRTSIVTNREDISWLEDDPHARCRFAVHRFDRIRVLVYEHSVAGFADVEVETQLANIFEGEDVSVTLPLSGKDATGEVSLVCRHIPLEYVPGFEPTSWFDRYVCAVM